MSELITRLLRHSEQVNREEDGAVHYDQVIVVKKLPDDTGYWSDEMKKHFAPMLRIGQLTNGYQFWQKVEDRRKGFNIA